MEPHYNHYCTNDCSNGNGLSNEKYIAGTISCTSPHQYECTINIVSNTILLCHVYTTLFYPFNSKLNEIIIKYMLKLQMKWKKQLLLLYNINIISYAVIDTIFCRTMTWYLYKTDVQALTVNITVGYRTVNYRIAVR